MSAPFDRKLPPLLAELHGLDVEYGDGDGIDFEPYQEFQSAEDNQDWIRAWTGNQTLDGAEYRVFGQDGSGGYAAFWMVRPGRPVLEQPIVFFGSEGELGVVARDFSDYLWLLAAGLGPYEVTAWGAELDSEPQPELAAFAEQHGGPAKQPADIIAAARAEFPDFEDKIRALIAS